MKIRIDSGDEYHLNDYHFLHRYRFVRNIGGGGDSAHVVLLDDFTKWNELAVAVEAAVGGKVEKTEFAAGGVRWQRKAGRKEIWPTADNHAVELTNDQIAALATWFNEAGYSAPQFPPKLVNASFKTAVAVLDRIKQAKPTTELSIQWPLRLPPGVGVDRRTKDGPGRDRYIWGDEGSVEDYPHIHCFVDGGYITSAHATIGPEDGSKDKRHPKFRSDLAVVRDGFALTAKDTRMLDELERVMRALVSGEELVRTTTTTTQPRRARKVVDEEPAPTPVPTVAVPVVAAELVRFADSNNITIERVVAFAAYYGIEPSQFGTWDRESFEEMEAHMVTD
ncbi:hypothetical protein [Saccharothrix texasensis]|uniref:Uncharacterized protein n=1 Tax=Saccharothrix texasensis TaxID=103734 RepID=A0A3N1HGX0_9PSEU|nr:hypothetical protein [Saccharothrix texasensis]ROP41740.1 hypothetical protein EDD40_7177 [Saccharothrix texasensis]